MPKPRHSRKTRPRAIIQRPASGRLVVPPRRIRSIDEDSLKAIHHFNLDIQSFIIYLVGWEKTYNETAELPNEPGVEYQMVTQFIKNINILSGLDPKRPILIVMKTMGGYWHEGMAVYDAIMSSPNPVTILSYTHARSMSSIILQAADKRVLMPNSYFLFHEGYVGYEGTNKAFKSYGEWVKKVQDPAMLDIYVKTLKRRGQFVKWSETRIRKKLQTIMDQKEDVYLTAQEAVDWGFADEVFGADGNFDWQALRRHVKV